MTRPSLPRLPLLLSALLVFGAAACGDDDVIIDDGSDSTLLVINESDFVIEEIFITDVDASGWGPNQLGSDVLFPGEDILLVGIECSVYDALIVAEDGAQCELLSIDLCFDDATWVIDNNTCDVFAAKAAEK